MLDIRSECEMYADINDGYAYYGIRIFMTIDDKTMSIPISIRKEEMDDPRQVTSLLNNAISCLIILLFREKKINY